MTGIISSLEAMRHEGMRLEVYRMAVQNGFYNEGPGTVAHLGYQIIPDGPLRYLIMRHGEHLITVKSEYIAKIWITCRVHNCGIIQASAILRNEQHLPNPQDTAQSN